MSTDAKSLSACSGTTPACSGTMPTGIESRSAYTGPVSTDSGSMSAYGVAMSTDAGSMSACSGTKSSDLGSMPACRVTKSTDTRSLSSDLGPLSTDLRPLSACTGPMPAEIEPMPARDEPMDLHAGPRDPCFGSTPARSQLFPACSLPNPGTTAPCRLTVKRGQPAAFPVAPTAELVREIEEEAAAQRDKVRRPEARARPPGVGPLAPAGRGGNFGRKRRPLPPTCEHWRSFGGAGDLGTGASRWLARSARESRSGCCRRCSRFG